MGKKKLLALLMATVLAMQPTISVTAETGQVTDSVGDYEGEETKEKSKVTELEIRTVQYLTPRQWMKK